MKGYEIVLTGDRTMMSDYGGGLFLGFISTGPSKGFIPTPLLFKFVFKPVPVIDGGRALLAPHGLRRIEAALLENGFSEDEVVISPPEALHETIGSSTKIIGIHSHDHLGRGPATTTMSGETGIIHEEPLSAYGFRKLVTSKIIQKTRKKGAVVVAGGPGAWQFRKEDMGRLGVDLVVCGEGEKYVPKIFKEIIEGEKFEKPAILHVPVEEIPKPEEIPALKGATIGGLIEVSRGCGRGCSFCRANLRPLRHRPLEEIKKDVEINVKYGQRGVCLHSEDIFRYGSTPFQVSHKKVVKLFKTVEAVEGAKVNSFSHANLSSIAAYPETVEAVAEIIGTSKEKWIGYETGIETGSSRLIEKHMKHKPYPFKPSEWKEVVEEAFAVSIENGLIPAATLIVNLPGEEEKDVVETVELIENLKNYKSLIVPLLYVNPFNPLDKRIKFVEDSKPYHWELYKVIWEHNMKWVSALVKEYTRENKLSSKIFLKFLILAIEKFFNRKATEFIEERMLQQKKACIPR